MRDKVDWPTPQAPAPPQDGIRPDPPSEGEGHTSIDATTQFSEAPSPEGEAADPRDPALPATLGPYQIEGRLGQGGMGQVLAAWDPRLSRRVALKRVKGSGGSPQARARLWREARALAALKDPGIVTVYDIGEDDEGHLYIAMELVEGWPVSRLVKAPWEPALAAWLIQEIAFALGACHRAGLVHRDLKPANVLVESGGHPKVVDFGLARGSDEEGVTETGAVIGTPAYMAPEQVEGDDTGPATDVFSLGVILYRLLAGQHPFQRDRARSTALAIAAARCTPLDELRPDLPTGLCHLVSACLAHAPEDRPGDGFALAAQLRALAQAEGWAITQGDMARFAQTHAPAQPDLPALPRSGPSSQILRPSSGRLPSGASMAPAQQAAGSLGPSLSVGTLAPPRAPAQPMRRLLALALGGVLVTGAAVAGFSALGVGTSGAPAIDGEALMGRLLGGSALPGELYKQLPPRPVIGVLGVGGPGLTPGEVQNARVLGDVLLARLSEDPEGAVTAPEAVVTLSGLTGDPLDPDTDLSPLTRAGRSLGHIDVGLRGIVQGAEGARRLTLEVVHILDGQVLGTLTLSGPLRDPFLSADVIAAALGTALDLTLPEEAAPLSRSADAYGAFLLARDAAYRSDLQGSRDHLAWALQLDPDLAPAQLLELPAFKAERRMDALKEAARALVARGDLSALDHQMAEAWLAVAQGRGPESTRILYDLLETWPYHIEAHQLLLALLSWESGTIDFVEAARVAKRLLRLTPHNEEAATRLVRALYPLGRIAEAGPILNEVGLPREAQYGEVWGDLAFYSGDIEAALPWYRGVSAAQEESLYGEHMTMASLILLGRCEEATQLALDRIDRVTRSGEDANLDWTYSLANQGLACLGHWAADAELTQTWAEHSESGRLQVAVWGPRARAARGEDPGEIAADILRSLAEDDLPHEYRAEQLLTLARVAVAPEVAERWQREAEGQSVRQGLSPLQRRRYRAASQSLKARGLTLRGDPGGALAALPADGHLSGDYTFGDFLDLELAVQRALILEARGDAPEEARALWEAVADAKEPRLWRTDLWYGARAHLRTYE